MTTHTFTPDHYFRTLGAHEPVLHIADGDTVITQTVDAFGRDAQDAQATPGGNPQTGPFYVEGAQPGDTLVFRIDRITPTREAGYTAHGLANHVVDADFLPEMPQVRGLQRWRIDVAAGTVTLDRTDTALGVFSLPLAPMIGCFGVAPGGGEAISTATSAAHGGNMDYRGFKAGTTVYFPVSVPGALVFLGDVHAVQGHGEIAGTGVEVSAEVEFTVQVIKGKRIHQPRGEDADYVFTAGNARPLDYAAQLATTEMVRLLEQDYGLDALSAGYVLGQAVEYEVGNFFDPAYTMICKLPKRLLAPYRRDANG